MAERSIHLTSWGDAGPRVIMVHGGVQGGAAGGAHSFSAQARLAERGWRVVVPDRPGHGRSPSPGRPDDAEADGAWVADLLEDGAHLVGHSFGACVALAAAAQRPGAVRSLTLIESGMQTLAMDDPHVRMFILRVLAARMFSLSDAARARRFMKIVGVPLDLRGGSDPDELKRVGRGFSRIRVPSRATLERQLGEIKAAGIPLLVITGGWSPAIDATAARVAAVGGGRWQVVTSPHHFPQLVSDEFNQVLAAFMTESDATAQAGSRA